MKVAGEDNHAEMMAGYKPVAEDTSTSCKMTQTFQGLAGQMTLQVDQKSTVTSRRSFTNMARKIELS